MKKLIACLLFLLLALPVNAEEAQPQSWAKFEPQWMAAFSRDSVQMLDKGDVKTVILDQGTTATVFLEEGEVKSLRVSYAGGPPVRYMKGIQQTINTILGKGPEAEDTINAFKSANPKELYKLVHGVCFERTRIEQLGWEFYATYGEKCPKKIK